MSTEAVCEELGRRVEQRRLEKNLTQQEVAEEVGITRLSYSRLEKGLCKLENLVATLRVLGELNQLEQFLPDETFSPLALLKQKGKLRQRATGSRKKESIETGAVSVADNDLDW